jgi:hypothetical protein
MKTYNEEVNSEDDEKVAKEILSKMVSILKGEKKMHVHLAITSLLVSMLEDEVAVKRRMTFSIMEYEVERVINEILLRKGINENI